MGPTFCNLSRSSIPEKLCDAGQCSSPAAGTAAMGIAVVKRGAQVLIYSFQFCSSIVFGALVSNYPETRQTNNNRLY